MKYLDKTPKLHETVKNIGSIIVGDCHLEKDCNIWFNSTIRGDMAKVHIKEGTNIQDNVVVHTDTDAPTSIGKHVTVGHSAIIHGCTVKDYALIGMGSVILDYAEVGEYAMVAAGCIVPPGKKVPPKTLVMGNPMRIIRELSKEEIQANIDNAKHYVRLAQDYHE
jgi:carbonic anhydrase/acetyltransferase-like protein (isoleucine patch superfamily)